MKRKFSLGNLLHNDRLILVISFVLAIAVWAAVVYGPSNEQERTISGIPVTFSLGEYAESENIRLIDGQDFTASVKVYGRRSVVAQLSAQDILLTVDTSTMIQAGTYQGLPIKAIKNGKQTDFEILSVEPAVATLTCDVWVEATFTVQTKMPGITSADETKYQLGTPLVAGDAVQNSTVTVTGPKSEIDTIDAIVAVVDETHSLSETGVFDATLKAVDKNGNDANIAHCSMNGDNASVRVTVPVLFYHRLDLKAQLLNAPTAYAGRDDVVVFDPPYLELWGSEQAIEEFSAQVSKLCTFDFSALTPEDMTQELQLQVPDTLTVSENVESITAKFNIGRITSKKLDLELTDDNVQLENCPTGLVVKPTGKTLKNIVICGPSNEINRIRTRDLVLTLNVNNEATLGQRTLTATVSVEGFDDVWIYYGENAAGYQMLATIEKSE